MSLTEYLQNKGIVKFREGNVQDCSDQVNDLIDLTRNAKNLLEIGFQAGHSAEVFLKNNKDITVVSFDLGEYDCVKIAKDYFDIVYKGRHRLILGDSIVTVPYFYDNNDEKFDIIFIDGNHKSDVAIQDLENCSHLAHKNTIIIMDDIVHIPGWQRPWTRGPTVAWDQHMAYKKIINTVNKQYYAGKGMAWGKFNLK